MPALSVVPSCWQPGMAQEKMAEQMIGKYDMIRSFFHRYRRIIKSNILHDNSRSSDKSRAEVPYSRSRQEAPGTTLCNLNSESIFRRTSYLVDYILRFQHGWKFHEIVTDAGDFFPAGFAHPVQVSAIADWSFFRSGILLRSLADFTDFFSKGTGSSWTGGSLKKRVQ